MNALSPKNAAKMGGKMLIASKLVTTRANTPKQEFKHLQEIWCVSFRPFTKTGKKNRHPRELAAGSHQVGHAEKTSVFEDRRFDGVRRPGNEKI